MSYKAITNKSSAQYKFIHSDKIKVCSDGLLRDKDGYIGVAFGSYYQDKIGDRFIVTFEDGKKQKFVAVDQKADKDTINCANHKTDGSMIEFVIDISKAKKTYKTAICMGNFDYADDFSGNIIKIEKVVG